MLQAIQLPNIQTVSLQQLPDGRFTAPADYLATVSSGGGGGSGDGVVLSRIAGVSPEVRGGASTGSVVAAYRPSSLGAQHTLQPVNPSVEGAGKQLPATTP
jgi:hypothetical protein